MVQSIVDFQLMKPHLSFLGCFEWASIFKAVHFQDIIGWIIAQIKRFGNCSLVGSELVNMLNDSIQFMFNRLKGKLKWIKIYSWCRRRSWNKNRWIWTNWQNVARHFGSHRSFALTIVGVFIALVQWNRDRVSFAWHFQMNCFELVEQSIEQRDSKILTGKM